ncbi:ABC transporter substrate-binding protein [Haloarculaceae archaeon H-GB11]|nr:ABC transporter substrate-binding protein [Haloarculaceae archaeon H-GB11]
MSSGPRAESVRRRAVLASLGAGATALGGGCVRRVRTLTGWSAAKPVQIRIKTVPVDADPYALRVARSIAAWFRTAGVDAQVVPMATQELFRQVLLQNDFGAFVGRLPLEFRSPDAFYPLLHSRFAGASGWQNPFGYTNLTVDEHLETQRHRSDGARRTAVVELQQSLARTQPFTVLAFPDDVRTARADAMRDWSHADLSSASGYLDLDADPGSSVATPTGETGTDRTSTLRIAVTDRRATENLNPLAAEFRRQGGVVSLLYDSLGVPAGESVEPRLADSWAFTHDAGAPRASVILRNDATWHDGEPVTPEDVRFTYEFLSDTSLGTADDETTDTPDDPVPAPRFQGRNSLVSSVRVVDSETVAFEFVECTPHVATRAFTIPILPEHVWADRTGTASLGGIEVGPATEALVTSNVPPVGSGPLQFVRNTPREVLVLEPFPDHFLTRDIEAKSGLSMEPEDETKQSLTAANESEQSLGRSAGLDFDRLVVRFVGSDETAVEMVADGDASVTGTPVDAATVPRIGRASDLELLVDRSNAPYVVGYNARRPPLTNPRFRQTLARLIDQPTIVDDVFDGYAMPAVSPLARTDWLASSLEWDGSNPVTPFLGNDGRLNVDRARAAFREVGYQYDGEALVEGN